MSIIRKGCGFRWAEELPGPSGPRLVSGFTVDNLDTKTNEQAENSYEKVFIAIRDELENWDSLSLDALDDRLQCTQVISDILRKEGLIK
jgi:hypothetical protein